MKEQALISGVIVSLPEFKHAFHCPADAPMVKPEAETCRIW